MRVIEPRQLVGMFLAAGSTIIAFTTVVLFYFFTQQEQTKLLEFDDFIFQQAQSFDRSVNLATQIQACNCRTSDAQNGTRSGCMVSAKRNELRNELEALIQRRLSVSTRASQLSAPAFSEQRDRLIVLLGADVFSDNELSSFTLEVAPAIEQEYCTIDYFAASQRLFR